MSAFDVVPPSVQAVVELFGSSLRDVSFPDVDAAALEAAVAELRARQEVVRQAEVALEAARQAREQSLDELVQKAEKALAYAKIYAANDAELMVELTTLSLPRRQPAVAAPTPKKRGRPRKVDVSAPLLEPAVVAAE